MCGCVVYWLRVAVVSQDMPDVGNRQAQSAEAAAGCQVGPRKALEGVRFAALSAPGPSGTLPLISIGALPSAHSIHEFFF